MRGADQPLEGIFSYVRLEQRVPADHPLRAIRDLVDAALKDLSRDFSLREGLATLPDFSRSRSALGSGFGARAMIPPRSCTAG